MPQPYMQLHGRWMKDSGRKVPPLSCRASSVVMMKHANGSDVPVRLQISSKEVGSDLQHVVAAEPVAWADAVQERRLTVTVNASGIVQQVRLQRTFASVSAVLNTS